MTFSALLTTNPAASHSAQIDSVKLNKTEIFRFDNGLTLLVREDTSAPVVSVQAWVATGSIHEGRWLGAGISHFVEHMLFKGTERRGVGQIAREAHDLGGRMNAYTSLDRTVYYIDLPSSGWAAALDIWVDAVFHSNFPEDEFIKEQEVIRREFAMGKDDPARVATLLLLETAFSVHPYRYPTIGYLDLFNRLTREDLVAYHAARYVPENVTFVIVGNVSAQEVRAEFKKLIAGIPRSFLEEVVIPQEPTQLAPRRADLPFATELLHLRLGWHVPGVDHPDAVALDALAVILGQGLSSRLQRSIVEDRALAHSISSFSFTPRGNGIFAVAALADPDKEEQLISAIHEEIKSLANTGVTEQELEKARRQVLTSFLSGLETMSGQAADVGHSWMLARDPDYSAAYVGRVQALSAEDLVRAVKKYLTPQGLTRVAIYPQNREVQSTAANEVLPSGTESNEPIITVKTLDNGVRLLIHKDDRLPLVNLQVAWLGGLLFETPSTTGLARLTGSTLLKGTKSRTAEQIANEIETLGGRIDIETGHNSSILSLGFLSSDLSEAVSLAQDVLLNPQFSQDEIERERALQIAAIRRERDQPMAICGDLVRSNLYGEVHPYSRNPLGTEKSLANFTQQDLKNYHQNTLLGGNTVVALFGDIDVEKATALLSEAFSKIPPGSKKIPSHKISISAEKVSVTEVMQRQQAVIQIGFPGLSLSDPLRPATEVLIQALSDMASRLFIRIREEQGLAYFVGAAQRMGPIPGHAVLYAGCAPEKADHVIQELLTEAADIAKNGLTDEEIQRAKIKLIGELVMQRQSQSGMARIAALNELFGLGANSVFHQEEEISSVTPEQVRKAAAQIFSAQPVIAKVWPGAENTEQ